MMTEQTLKPAITLSSGDYVRTLDIGSRSNEQDAGTRRSGLSAELERAQVVDDEAFPRAGRLYGL